MALAKRVKRTKKVENKDYLGIEGSIIDPELPETQPFFVRTEFTIQAMNVGTFPDYNFERTEFTIAAKKV